MTSAKPKISQLVWSPGASECTSTALTSGHPLHLSHTPITGLSLSRNGGIVSKIRANGVLFKKKKKATAGFTAQVPG